MRVVHGEVPNRELLVANPDAVFAAVEDEVAHKTAGAILHKYSLMSLGFELAHDPDKAITTNRVRSGAHIDDDVNESGSLSNLPMDPSGGRSSRHSCKVNLEMSDGLEEVLSTNGVSDWLSSINCTALTF